MRRLFLETGQHRAGRTERAVVHRDRPTEDWGVVIRAKTEVAVYREVSVDEIAEGAAAGADGLPIEWLCAGGRAMERNRIQAVAGPGVAADRAAEVSLADAVEVNRRIGGRICHAAGAATGDGIRHQGQVVGRHEVHAVGTGARNGVVLDIDRPTAEGRPKDRFIRAALEVVAQYFESTPGDRTRGPGVTRVDPVVTWARATALQVRSIRWHRVDPTEFAATDVDRRGVDGDAVGEGWPQAAVADDKTVGPHVGPAYRRLPATDVDRLGGEQDVGVDDVACAPDQADTDPFIGRQR